ncbi:uncharacterized protein LOC143356191 [Halictus rubicundus]|uniref:uncharacterized protein LOC143356191 n=1 Tax=Halictus rubicundus TaxID=77578 RepID=UPI0040368628
MDRRVLKTSVSRKPYNKLSDRQKRSIRREIASNLRKFSRDNKLQSPPNVDNLQDIPSTSSLSVPVSNNSNESLLNIPTTSSFTHDSSSTSLCDDVVWESAGTVSEVSFRDRLASCFVDNNITHTQGNNILSLLRTHSCFSGLPKDIRTLISTARTSVITSVVEPGEYVHFNVELEIIKQLSKCSPVIPGELQLDFHVDGCTLDRSNRIQIWPIQVRIVNILNSKPIVVGIYKGTQKPKDCNSYLQKFVSDINLIMSNGGITFHKKKIPVVLRCFIADAPVRAFILHHRGHMSHRPCSKCKVCGTQERGCQVFNGITHPLRNDEEYIRCSDKDHHKDGQSPLALMPIGMVSQVPFEYMHLVCLGVTKKLLSAWVYGKYSPFSKLSSQQIFTISERMRRINKYCPSEFAKHPRSIDLFSKFKATEFRQFLLYTGPVVTYGVLNYKIYRHFLFLHSAIRIMVSQVFVSKYLKFAEGVLQLFVRRCEKFYGPTFNSSNVHGLLHLANDVRRFGTLDSFSAFPYESNMSIFRKYCRKPGQPLQQLSNRMREIEHHGSNKGGCDSSTTIQASMMFHNSSGAISYRKLQIRSLLLGTDERDNCCILHDGTVCIISSISPHENSFRLGVQRFLQVDTFYDIALLSPALEIFKCDTLSTEITYVSQEDVRAKCYRMPLEAMNVSNESSTDEEDDNILGTPQWVIAVLVHFETV